VYSGYVLVKVLEVPAIWDLLSIVIQRDLKSILKALALWGKIQRIDKVGEFVF
jgi:hypothetical protein